MRVVPGSPPVALYVHVPFCVSICPYCDFVVYAGSVTRGPRARVDAFVEALERELELRADALDAMHGTDRPALQSLYLGGGTPSLVDVADIARLVDLVRTRYGLVDDAEVTLEANPGPDERGDPAAWVRAGITRLSLGAQSMDDAQLKRLGRRHRASHVVEAVAAARAAGMPSVSLDLLYDVPDQSVFGWMTTLDAALDLGPDHLSLYALTLDDPDAEGLTGPTGDHLPTIQGARRWRELARPLQDEDHAAAQYHHAVVRLAETGYHGYEISNWAKPGHESRHNRIYWERRPYEAVGPGAHAFDGTTRRWNAANLERYIGALTPADRSAPRLPPGGSEQLDAATAASERLILGLRLDTGIPFADTQTPPVADAFIWALTAELVDVTADDRVVLTTRGRLLSNELFARLV